MGETVQMNFCWSNFLILFLSPNVEPGLLFGIFGWASARAVLGLVLLSLATHNGPFEAQLSVNHALVPCVDFSFFET